MIPAPAQLEIISASGHIEFYTLDPAKGITNIGSHPENDIVLRSPGIAPFHAMLDHRQQPVRIILLAQNGRTTMGGEKLVPNVSRAVHASVNIQLDGYTILLADDSRTGFNYPPQFPGVVSTPSQQAYPSAVRPAAFGPPPSRPENLPGMAGNRALTPPPFYGVPGAAIPDAMSPRATQPIDAMAPRLPVELTTPASDVLNDVVVTEIDVREQVTDVSQTAIFRLTVINGGDIVAMFMVDVIGVPPAWVTISPPNVNLYEGDRATITVSITPPRMPSSRAGIHYLAFKITSPNYPGHISQRAGTLIINPYYEFTLSELAPRQQTISWFAGAGAITLSLHNQSNTPTVFQVDAEDDERGCTFEFNMPGEPLARVRQADVRLPADTSATIPITIMPRSRRLFGLRRRRYGYTVTTSMPESGLTPRSMLGELNAKALFGPVVVAMMALLFAMFIVWVFYPRIRTFNSDGSNTRVIRSGEMITLRWNASPLVNLKINPVLGELDGPVGTATVLPTADVVYELRAENWLSRLSPRLFTASEEVRVFVTPIPPDIRFFEVDQNEIVQGEEINLSWHVVGADDLLLQINGLPQPLDTSAGTLTDDPDRETSYTLIASNQYKSESLSRVVRVLPPTPTPIPTPAVVKFVVNPPSIVEGESVVIEWEVQGADDVSVAPLGAGLPPVQSVIQSPLQTTNYILNASKGSARIEPLARTVFVTPAPTATPEPDAPEIVFFVADPQSLVSGKSPDEEIENQVQLTWSVKGQTTNVEISGPSLGSPISNLKPSDSIFVNVEETTLFVLTAFNQDKKSSANAQVTVNEATPTPTPTTTPAPSATPIPPPKILVFKVVALDNADSGKITSTDNKYEVRVGTDIKLSWATSTDAEAVILSPVNEAFGPGPGEKVLLQFSEDSVPSGTSKDYTLIAQKTGTAGAEATITVKVVPVPVPNPPSAVNGSVSGNDNTIVWTWSGDVDNILGFRVKRSNIPPGNQFSTVFETLDPNVRNWTDVGGGCGKVYHIVTLYPDLDLDPIETGPSSTSWASGTCP